MRISALAILFCTFAATLASPVSSSNDLASISKRCCILCDNLYARCGSNDKREAVETEEEALFGPTKRCCLNCDNPNVRYKRDETLAQWPSKRCCILCDNSYARCGSNDKRDVVESLEDAVVSCEDSLSL
ncbi:hypothetical protein N7532_007336 [Penicillium argentinense]|uniref:Uncharacterized protein n=1 Tax=Penicillium argentinense TaxID=1131581 RepID=A0A9W9F7H9_9EURO|nr:uncharacterized protein N7532_007336 [Penicillium argentinense]KAJ5095045.1 hypothetical protein N7532_007336 [Penicillium argentinense]